MTAAPAQPPAVVVALDNITGLQTARILAARGVPVVGVAADRRHFACRTRACREVVQVDTAGDDLVGPLEALAARLPGRPVLFPCSDLSVLAISRNRERLAERFAFTLPDADVIDTLTDKLRFHRFAEAHALPVPRSFLLHDRDDAERCAAHVRFPATMKPPMKTPAWEAASKAKVHRVGSAEELLATYDRYAPVCDALLVQEWVEGPESALLSCNCYVGREGEVLVTFVARKLRQWPPDTGTSSLGEECADEVVLRETLRLFRSVGYRGLGYLEMKRDVRTGEHFVIEPNIGRPTGRSAIAEAGGVELLYTAYCDTAGLPLPPPEARRQAYRGAKWIYLRRDLQAAAHRWRGGELGVGEWLRSLRGVRADAVLSWRDPAPFVVDVGHAVAKAVRRG